MHLPKELTTATNLSKTIAFILFVTLPILGFLLGMGYQQNLVEYQSMQKNFMTIYPTPMSTSISLPSFIPTNKAISKEDLEVPDLYPKFTWTLVEKNQQMYSQFPLRLVKGLDYKDISLTGSEWTARYVIYSKEEYLNSDTIFNYYYDELNKKRGWTGSENYNGWELAALNAGGPNGNVYGLIKLVGDKFRVFILADHIVSDPKEKISTSGPMELSYPHTRGYEIFVSDVFTVEDVIPK